MQRTKKIIIGLTGGIASGKSLVLEEFKRLGAGVVDADEIAHKIILKDTIEYRLILKHFGKKILKPNSEIDRSRLAGIIFSNRRKRRILERITHKRIISRIRDDIARSNRKIVVVCAPLLFEARIGKLFDRIITVWVPLKVNVGRLTNRNNITKPEALKRIKSQIPLDKKIKMSDFVIDNSGTFNKTRKQAARVWNSLEKL